MLFIKSGVQTRRRSNHDTMIMMTVLLISHHGKVGAEVRYAWFFANKAALPASRAGLWNAMGAILELCAELLL